MKFGKFLKIPFYGTVSGHFPDGHIPDGHFPEAHFPEGHFPDQTHPRRTFPRWTHPRRTLPRTDTFFSIPISIPVVLRRENALISNCSNWWQFFFEIFTIRHVDVYYVSLLSEKKRSAARVLIHDCLFLLIHDRKRKYICIIRTQLYWR